MAKTGAIAKLKSMAKERNLQAGGIAKLAKMLKGAKEVPAVNRLDMNFKDVTKRVPELTEAAQKVAAGQMTAKEYADLVNRVKPVKPYEFVPMPASDEDAARALTSNKRAMFGKTREIPAGEATDLRLDIPAYKDHGVWVNSVHRKGQPTAYGPVSSVKNATMSGAPDKAMRVATGEAAKGPWAVISGEWNPMDEAAAVKNAQKYLKHKDWRQVGYDPERHGYFYDRATMDPIIGADEVIQIGPLVLAKKPKYGNPDDFPFKEGGKVEDKAYIGYRRAGRRPESQQNREASANIPVAVARGLVSGTLGLPGDIESLARLPYELITGKESKTILPTSEDIEKRLPFRGASQTPVGQMFTGASQLAGGAYTGPLSGARAAMAVPRAIKRAGQDFAMASTQGIPRMFIGPKAKTWDQAKADAAVRMEQEGRDPVDIWRQTGTFRGADGIMRQEISDVGAIYRDPKDLKELGKQKKQEALDLGMRMITPIGQKDFWPKALTEAKRPVREEIKRLKAEADELGRFSDVRGQSAKFVLEHPELYKAYPELADIPVYQGNKGFGGASAGLMGGKGDMEVNIYQQGLRGNPRSSMLHEMQHAVQTLEDMAPGGSPSMAFQDPAAFKILEDLRAKASTPMSFEDYAERYSHLANKEAGYQDYLKSIPGIVKNMDRELQSQAAMEYYKRLAGEAEARATQMREPMSASQRAQEFPYSSYDVLPEDLIVKPAKGTVNALQTVYHGSPHKFDKFDSSKIGTGEGAQSYGHGLYLAESPGVAKSYRRNLSSSVEVPEGTPALEKRIAEMAVNFGGDDPIAWLQKYEKGAGHTVPALTPELVASTIKKFESGEFRPGGNLYTVDLPDEKIARMLDWDKPLSQQPEVIKALKGTDYEVGMSQREAEKVADMRLRQEADEWAEMTGGDPVDYSNNVDWEKYVDQVRKESGSIDSSITGKDLHRMIMRDEGYRPELFDPENYQIGTSEALRGYGIPGIRYLDATSRDAGKGTSNFVVFPGEEDALTILERKKEGGEVKMAKGGSTSDELRRLLGGGMKDGGAVDCGCNDEPKMQAGGAAKTLKNLLGGGSKAEDAATAAQRAAAGRMAADVAKATQPMKMSEALGNLNVEGKGKVKVTQSDRTRVGGGNIGGAMFPGLSQVDPFYQDLVWGVGKKSTGSGLINQSDDLTYWSTILGSEDQLKSNPIVFNKLRAGFVDAMKQGKLSKELEDKINKNLSVTFGEGADIRDPKIWQKADTFERRTALADVMLGQGLPPNKGGVPLGGEKSGKGVIFKPTDILKRETEPLLLHPEHGGDVPTFAVGPRLFQFSGGMKVRPDLHPGFPVLLEGQDMGMVFRPAPGEIAMRDFTQRMLNERGRKPGYYEWTMGESGKGLPSQLITDEYLTYLQKQGYAEGGEVKSGLSALEKV